MHHPTFTNFHYRKNNLRYGIWAMCLMFLLPVIATGQNCIGDEIPPKVTYCPPSLTVDYGGDTTVAHTGIITATDNCGIWEIIHHDTYEPDEPDVYKCGHYNFTVHRTWTVRDFGDNRDFCNQDIFIRDQTPPTAKCKTTTATLVNGTATITGADVDDGSFDNASPVTLSVSPSTFTSAQAGQNVPVTLTVKDVCGNTSTCTTSVHVNTSISCNITVIPANNTYTGGVPTNIYIGYGPQSATLNATATGGSGFTYLWSGPTGLSCTACANPIFTPSGSGTYKYKLTATNSAQASSNCYVTFCVKDIRVAGKDKKDKDDEDDEDEDKGDKHGKKDKKDKNAKVYLCHVVNGNSNNSNTLSINSNDVSAHLSNHPGDHLGQCTQTCGTVFAKELSPVHGGDKARIYPNPNHGSFTVELPYLDGSAEILVMDVQGRTITRKIITEDDSIKVDMELGSITPGIYFVQLKNGENIQRSKLIIQ